jgi:4-methylaminobutanoate oxidase (formaldehyde-forming)
LYPILKAKGAVWGAKYGWERTNWFAPDGIEPVDELAFGISNWFEHVANEHRNARENVVIVDQTSFCKFKIKGPGALNLLNRLSANQIDKPVGTVVYTQMCNDRGTIECDLTIARIAEQKFFLVVGTAFGLRASWWIKNHMPSDGSVSFQDVTSAYAVINLIGPKSRDLLQKVAPGDLSNEGFPFSTCKSITVGYAPVMAFRVTYVGNWDMNSMFLRNPPAMSTA